MYITSERGIFQHFVFTVVRLIDLWIPDVPEKLEALIHLEDSFAREMMKEVIEVRVVFDLGYYRLVLGEGCQSDCSAKLAECKTNYSAKRKRMSNELNCQME